MKPTILAAALALLATALPGAGARAHEFVVAPAQARVAAGQPLEVAVYSTHTILAVEELEPTELNAVTLIQGTTRTPVPLQGDEGRLLQIGRVTAPSTGTFILAGHRLPITSTLTAQGRRPGTRAQNPGGSDVRRTEKFSKSLVNLSPDDRGFTTVVGHRLEIVPLANPASVRVGDELAIRVLFEGQPLGTPVLASWQGFTERANTYAYYTEADADGTARIRITSPGLWVVRVENRRVTPNAEVNVDTTRATLVFQVQ